jgi:excisionase family DNA binding protein
MEADYLTCEEIADRLKVHVVSVRRLANLGEIPARKVLGQWRFAVRDVDEWLERSKNEPPPLPRRALPPRRRGNDDGTWGRL